MELLVGDRSRSVAALIAVKMWKDPDFRRHVVEDPRAVLEEEGISIPDDATVVVKENTADVTYVPLPRDAHLDPDPDAVLALFERLLPIREGHELRLVQSTEETRYFVIPETPTGIDPAKLTDAELLKVAGGAASVSEEAYEATTAVTTEEVATETTEAQDAETTTTVVAEAELVAT